MDTAYQAEQEEGAMTRKLDEQTAKLPSGIFFGAAVGSIGVSWLLQLLGNKEKSHFVGQWVAPFMLLAIYTKLLKVSGADRVFH